MSVNNDDQDYTKDKPDIYFNEVRLYQAILINAMFEATNKTTPKLIRRSAIRWLTSDDNELLDLCCYLCGFNLFDVQKRLDEINNNKASIDRRGIV